MVKVLRAAWAAASKAGVELVRAREWLLSSPASRWVRRLASSPQACPGREVLQGKGSSTKKGSPWKSITPISNASVASWIRRCAPRLCRTFSFQRIIPTGIERMAAQ